jgi:MYXO-CTERM domain-containing protein
MRRTAEQPRPACSHGGLTCQSACPIHPNHDPEDPMKSRIPSSASQPVRTARSGPPAAAAAARHLKRSLGLAFALLCSQQALAASSLELLDRSSTSQVRAFAGYGISGVAFPCETPETDFCSTTGSTGSLAVVSGTGTPTVSVAGTGTGFDTALVFSTGFDATWSQTQTFSFGSNGADSLLRASGSFMGTMQSWGSNGIQPPQPAAQRMESWNWQAFTFTLDQATAYTLTGGSTGGQQLQMWWTSPAGVTSYRSDVIGNTGLASFNNSGTLQAGTYLLRNFEFVMASVEDSYANSWDYTLTFRDTVTAVPEPTPAAMLLAGLVAVGAWRQRRLGLQLKSGG